MKLCLCLVMLSSVAAVQDMTGKVFTFPQETNTAHVKLSFEPESFSIITICHRSFTDLTRDHALFSLATPSIIDAVLTFYDSSANAVAPHFHDVKLSYRGLDYSPNKWHSMCTTWSANTRLAELWFDGQPLSKKYIGQTPEFAFGPSIIVLGQDQDTYGGGFDAKKSFVGMMTDVHVWDHKISDCEIQKYMDGLSFTPGNKINWAALDYELKGNVLVDYKKESCDSKWIK